MLCIVIIAFVHNVFMIFRFTVCLRSKIASVLAIQIFVDGETAGFFTLPLGISNFEFFL